MKLVILNGIPDDANYFEIEKSIESDINNLTSHNVDYFKLRDLKISFCTGCWDCWVKTPGECAIRDDQTKILEAFVHADHVLFVSPIIVGYESALLKKTKDRIIPFAHPYIEIYKGEQHHRKRYPKSPDLSVLLIEDEFTDTEDIHIIKDTYTRISLNFQSTFKDLKSIDCKGGNTHVLSSFKW
jgi:multimeric flavodoxin WrbA